MQLSKYSMKTIYRSAPILPLPFSQFYTMFIRLISHSWNCKFISVRFLSFYFFFHSSFPKSIFISVLQTIQSDIFLGSADILNRSSFISLFALMRQAVACACNKSVTLPWNLKHWRQRRWRVFLNYRNSFKKLISANIFFCYFLFTLGSANFRISKKTHWNRNDEFKEKTEKFLYMFWMPMAVGCCIVQIFIIRIDQYCLLYEKEDFKFQEWRYKELRKLWKWSIFFAVFPFYYPSQSVWIYGYSEILEIIAMCSVTEWIHYHFHWWREFSTIHKRRIFISI